MAEEENPATTLPPILSVNERFETAKAEWEESKAYIEQVLKQAEETEGKVLDDVPTLLIFRESVSTFENSLETMRNIIVKEVAEKVAIFAYLKCTKEYMEIRHRVILRLVAARATAAAADAVAEDDIFEQYWQSCCRYSAILFDLEKTPSLLLFDKHYDRFNEELDKFRRSLQKKKEKWLAEEDMDFQTFKVVACVKAALDVFRKTLEEATDAEKAAEC